MSSSEIVVGAWLFDANRRTFGYWTSDVGRLDLGFVETGPWIEYPELHPGTMGAACRRGPANQISI